MAETPTPICDAKCVLCHAPVVVRMSSKEHLYYNCKIPDEGGCGVQVFGRYALSDHLLAKRSLVWRATQKLKDLFFARPVNMPPVPEPEPEPEPEPAPASAPSSAPAPRPAPARRAAPTKPKSIWDMEI